LNFAVCVDRNRQAREAAKERKRQKDFAFAQEGLKFANREVSYQKTLDTNVLGYSRSLADAYSKALYTQAKGREELEGAAKTYFAKKSVDEGGRSRRFGVKDYQALLAKKAEVEGINRTNFGRNFATFQEGARRQFQTANAKARESLGLPPIYGLSVMMPPKDRLGGALQILQSGLSIGSSMMGLGAFGASTTGPLSFINPFGT